MTAQNIETPFQKTLKRNPTSSLKQALTFPELIWCQQESTSKGLYCYNCVGTAALLNHEWANGAVHMKRELMWEVRFARNFLSRNTCCNTNTVEGNVMKIFVGLLFQTRTSWQPLFRLLRRHQHFVCWDFSVQDSCKTKANYFEYCSCYRYCCGLLDLCVLSSKYTRI